MIEAVIFDFDGVLFTSEAIHFALFQQILKRFELSVSEEEYFKKCVGIPNRSIFQMLLAEGGYLLSDEDLHTLVQEKIALYQQMISTSEQLPSVPGVLSFLKSLHGKISKFGVCTNGEREAVKPTLDRLEGGAIASYMQCLVALNDLKQGKPYPEGYLTAAHYLGVEPQHCVVIEDSRTGIAAGKSAGMTVIGLATTHEPSVLNQADFVGKNYAEIEEWFKQNLK